MKEKELEAIKKENESLKKSVASYKGANTKYRELVKVLQSQRDEALEEHRTMQQTLEKEAERVLSLNNQILEYKDKINALRIEVNDLNYALEYEQKPWWKKLF